jgi:hypothetical protein
LRAVALVAIAAASWSAAILGLIWLFGLHPLAFFFGR